VQASAFAPIEGVFCGMKRQSVQVKQLPLSRGPPL
jgi:hypothetical protein